VNRADPNGPTVPLTCPICGRTITRGWLRSVPDYISGERFDIGSCQGCGVLVTEDAPAPGRIADYYGPRYRGRRHSLTTHHRARRRRAAIRRAFEPGFRGRLLDIGCGTGEFLLEMQRAGWQVAGTELDADAVAIARRHGLQVTSGLPLTPDALGTFDAITCWHVLEHVADPRGLLRSAAQLLAPAGVFHVSVPDAASRHARWFGANWFHFDVPRHLVHFSRNSLLKALADEGFVEESVTRVVVAYDWFGVVQGALNAVSAKPNVLFERLTTGRFPPGTSLRDRVLAAVAGPLLGIAAVPVLAADVLLSGGATIGVLARRARR
jgi:SAM-dependent methyltransferase